MKKNHLLSPLSAPPPPPLLQRQKKRKEKTFFLDLDYLLNKFTCTSQSFLTLTLSKKNSDLESFEKNITDPSHIPTLPLPPTRIYLFIFFVRFGFFYKKNSLSRFFVKENFTYPSRHHPPTENIIHLRIIFWILVQSDTVDDHILFGGHCDLYIMVQRFCLISLTISDRKISYRSLKQTAGSTSCPWTTILVFVELLYLSRKVRSICLIILQSLTSYQQFFPD